MKKLILIFLAVFLLCSHLYSGEENKNLFRHEKTDNNLDKTEKSVKKINDGVYFLYKKCNLKTRDCHQLQPLKVNGHYFLDGNQEPYEERMYLYIKGGIKAVYSLIYYDEEMIPTITWSKLVQDNAEALTYLISETHLISGIDDNTTVNNFDFTDSATSDSKIKIGDFPQGRKHFPNQKILFVFEENGDLSLNCEEYLNNLKVSNKGEQEFSSSFGGIFEMGCNANAFFRNTAQYGEDRAIYFRKID